VLRLKARLVLKEKLSPDAITWQKQIKKLVLIVGGPVGATWSEDERAYRAKRRKWPTRWLTGRLAVLRWVQAASLCCDDVEAPSTQSEQEHHFSM